MAIFDFLRRRSAPAGKVDVHASSIGGVFLGLDDPRLIDLMRSGDASSSGATVNVESAMRNTSLFRAVSLISYAIGMLPLQLIDEQTKEKATGHPLYRLLHREPNNYQTAFDFRTLMQLRALVKGNAYALIIRSKDVRTAKPKVVRLVPLDPDKVSIEQNDDWSISYTYRPIQGAARVYKGEEVFHLRGLSLDGISGLSIVKQARDAIGLSISAELAASRLFKNGAFVGGMLKHPGKLSDPAFERLKQSIAEKEGAENAGKTLIGEEGLEWVSIGQNARDAQLIEVRRMQVEEIARVTGVPRPLLMVDETSWGSGIEALGRFFVQYALGPWFEAWQQAAERSLLLDDEKDLFSVKFNPAALLRGSTKDQADFFAKALGTGAPLAGCRRTKCAASTICQLPPTVTP
ncbi:phage portal protein [Devosia aurantiaca]|uniref:phage portal protein n=1 Tax=Devosia aurantiaca TaxID=2714858 RepID=UPI001F4704B5|nr:phage portal protein [Devosia aurantiaca]